MSDTVKNLALKDLYNALYNAVFLLENQVDGIEPGSVYEAGYLRSSLHHVGDAEQALAALKKGLLDREKAVVSEIGQLSAGSVQTATKTGEWLRRQKQDGGQGR